MDIAAGDVRLGLGNSGVYWLSKKSPEQRVGDEAEAWAVAQRGQLTVCPRCPVPPTEHCVSRELETESVWLLLHSTSRYIT